MGYRRVRNNWRVIYQTRQKGLQNIQRPKVIKARGGTMLPGLSRAKWSPEAGGGATVVSC